MLHIAVPLGACALSPRPQAWRSQGPERRATALTASWCLLGSVRPHTVRRLLPGLRAHPGCSVTSGLPTMGGRSPAALAGPDAHCRGGDAHLPVRWTCPSLLARVGIGHAGGPSADSECLPTK